MIKKGIFEFIGTFFLIFFGCGSIILNNIRNSGAFLVGLSFGITLMAMIYISGKVSGAHFNPAISFTFFVMGEIRFAELIVYTISQLLGGLLSVFFLVLIFGRNFNYTELYVENSIISATDLNENGIIIILEFIFAFIVMFLYSKATIDGKIKSKFAPFFIGGIFCIGAAFLVNIDKAGLNVVRIIVTSLYNFKWQYFIYYICAHWVGTFLGGITYSFVNQLKRFKN